jgi:hypothetical protein
MSAKKVTTLTVYDPAVLADAGHYAVQELEAARRLTITSDADAADWAEMAREVAVRIKALEAMRQSVVAPLNEAKSALQAIFVPRQDDLARLQAYVKAELGRWSLAKVAEQRRQMAAAATAANADDEQALTEALQAVAKLDGRIRLEGVSTREVWTAEIIAPDMVPFDWRIPDEKRIKAAARATAIDMTPTPIPGVRFVKVASTTVRS